MAQLPTHVLPMWRLLLWKSRDRLRREWRSTTARWRTAAATRPRDWEETVSAAAGEGNWSRHFAKRERRWLWTDSELDDIAAWMRAHRPEICRATLYRAQRAVERRVDILGYGEVTVPDDYDWVTDPIAGVTWPRHRTEQVPIILGDPRSDIKHLWEIARFAFAPTLGAAWRTTGDRSCAKSLVSWIDDFISANPCGYGPHWTNPMEAAIRAVNWMVGWSLCRPVAADNEDFVRRFIGSLIDHGRFIAANLERTHRGINTNHYIADLVGLYAIAAFLPEWLESAQWRSLAVRELAAEAEAQILPDGFCYESSFAYHRLTFEMWFFVWRLARALGEPELEALSPRLRRMAAFSRWNADSAGRLPSFGDGDDGRFVFWQPRDPHDHTTVWELAEAVWEPIDGPHPHRVSQDPSEDVLWLVGTAAYHHLIEQRAEARSSVAALSGVESCLFPDAGIAVIRSPRWLVHAYANPVGSGGVGGHKHNDLLSLTATCDGTAVIIDPGTWAYSTDPPLRNRFRRTAAHATVVVDGREQNRFLPRQLFALRQDALPGITTCESADLITRVVMSHDGYHRLASPVHIEREVRLAHSSEALSIIDRLTGAGEHDIEVVFPLGDLRARVIDNRSVLLRGPDSAEVTLALNGDGNWALQLTPAWRSEAYGCRRSHQRLIFAARIALPAAWTVTLTPVAITESTPATVPDQETQDRGRRVEERAALLPHAAPLEVVHAGS